MSVPLTLKVKVKEEQVVGGKTEPWRRPGLKCAARSTTAEVGAFHGADVACEVAA